MRYAICRILGDGQPPKGYYLAIEDVLIPGEGIQAFNINRRFDIGSVADGTLTWGLAAVELVPGATWRLLDGNQDVDLLPEYPVDAAVSAMHLPTRQAMTARMQARGIDTAFIGGADGFRDILSHLGLLHDSTFSVDEFVV